MIIKIMLDKDRKLDFLSTENVDDHNVVDLVIYKDDDVVHYYVLYDKEEEENVQTDS